MSRTALITGAAGALGHATVSLFVADGWRVVCPVRPGSAGRAPAGAIAIEADLTDQQQVRDAVEVAVGDAEAPLRAVANLVGGYAGAGRVHETPIEDFEAMLRINLRPLYLVTSAALPALVAAGGGAVVCVSSRAAVSPFPGAAGYATAKAGVVAFSNAVAVEYKKQNVRCNTVLPGVIDTPANRAAMPDAKTDTWVPPEQIASVIRFLASDESRPATGAAIPV